MRRYLILRIFALGVLAACNGEGGTTDSGVTPPPPPPPPPPPCVPTTCEAEGKNCGTMPDGCGGLLSCGSCTTPNTCGGGGSNNVCGPGVCIPSTCGTLGADCGPISDGCQDVLQCGTCTPPETCGGGGTANLCGCTPVTCDDLGKNCGEISNGCGLMIPCGICTAPERCGGGGPNICGTEICTPLTCAGLGKNCGPLFDGCSLTLDCGTCTDPETCGGGGTAGVCGVELPPDPATVAPALDPAVITVLSTAARFLYEGANPIQRGVTPGAIEPRRIAVLRGRVLDTTGAGLSGAQVTILDQPQLGYTYTRADGAFDLAVNGGDRTTVNITKNGYLPAQRTLEPAWQDFARVETILLVALDTRATTINFSAPLQAAQSSMVIDGDGTRRTTLFFEQGTVATAILPDGTSRVLPSITVRATEYTVGPRGPEAMPAELPPSSAYTWASELSVDEARALNADEVRFDRPVIFYQDNFLAFPVGTSVPAGYYDRRTARWVPVEDGRVVRVLDTSGGIAALDVDGSGSPANAGALAALGISDTERTELANLYGAGAELWRARLDHFSPLDCNWPYRREQLEPEDPEPEPEEEEEEDPCEEPGSIIQCQNQTLGEKIAVTGTPFELRYQSNRQAGYAAANTLKVKLSRDSVPSQLRGIRLAIDIGGQTREQTFSAAAGQRHTFTWDGRDGYGRRMQGWQRARVSLGFTYPLIYSPPAPGTQTFGLYTSDPNISLAGEGSLRDLTLWKRSETRLGIWDARGHGALGGWSLNIHHAYDPIGRVLYLGTGERRSVRSLNRAISTDAGDGTAGSSGDGGRASAAKLNRPHGLAIDGAGNLYVADRNNHKIRRIAPDGSITTIAGTGAAGFSGEGAPATAAALYWPEDVALDGRGNIYVADSGNHRLRRIGRDGRIVTIAGQAVPGSSGDGGPATSARLSTPAGVAVDLSGNIYVADLYNHKVRRIGTDQIITTIAGDGIPGFSGDGGPAARARLYGPNDVAVDREGVVYIADSSNHRIRRIAPDGVINTIAGDGRAGYDGDGGPATLAALNDPSSIAVDSGGNLWITDRGNHRLRWVKPSGAIVTAAGTGTPSFSGDGDTALSAEVNAAAGVAVHPLGSVFLADTANHRLRRVELPLPGFSENDVIVPSRDGLQQYVFDVSGRHRATLDARTSRPVYTFAYDAAGRLSSIADAADNTTAIERSAGGAPSAIISPYGHRSTIAVDGNGYLASITDPLGRRIETAHDSGGLLSTLTDGAGGVHRFGYDSLGRLTSDQNAAGVSVGLTRTSLTRGYSVERRSPLGRVTRHEVHRSTDGSFRRVSIHADGTQSEVSHAPSGSRVRLGADGTRVELVEGATARFGLLAPSIRRWAMTTPGGLSSTMESSSSASLSDPSNPLSLASETKIMAINGKAYTNTYDAAARRVTYSTPAARQVLDHTDADGRLISRQLGTLHAVRYEYDARGRISAIRQGSGAEERVLSYGYDGSGAISLITDPLGRAYLIDRDAAGQLTRMLLPDGNEMISSYDGNGKIITTSPPGRPAHVAAYDGRGLPIVHTVPAVAGAGDTTMMTWDGDRQLSQLVRPGGQTLNFGYDTAGRLATVTSPRGTHTYIYSPTTGAPASISSPDGVIINYEYDGVLPTRLSWSGPIAGSVTFAYDSDLRIISQTIGGQPPLTYQYDDDALVTGAGALAITRDPSLGLVTSTSLGGVSTSHTWDSFGALASRTATYLGTTLLAESYTRDRMGRIVTRTETIGGTSFTEAYEYDELGRLITVRRDGSITHSYAYDANGNRTSANLVAATYDAQDRLLSSGSRTHTYTPAGDLATRTDGAAVTTYNYDALGDLLSVSLPDGRNLQYLWDARHRRVGKRIGGVPSSGLLFTDGLHAIAELDGAGAIRSRFVYGTTARAPDYMIRGGATYRIIFDQLGSVRLVVDVAGGAIAQRLDYDAFGMVVLDTNPGFQPFGFAGGIYDPDTGLTRFGARDYDASAGRFTVKDPIGFAGGQANVYAYAKNDPINLSDPSGYQGETKQPEGFTIPFIHPVVYGEAEHPAQRDAVRAHEMQHVKDQRDLPYYFTTENWELERRGYLAEIPILERALKCEELTERQRKAIEEQLEIAKQLSTEQGAKDYQNSKPPWWKFWKDLLF